VKDLVQDLIDAIFVILEISIGYCLAGSFGIFYCINIIFMCYWMFHMRKNND